MASGDENISNFLSYLPGGGLLDDLGGFGGRAAARAAKKAEQAMQAELDRRRGITPGAEDIQAVYNTNDMLGDSQAAGAYADAGSIAGQQDALSALQNVYQNQGMTDQDRAYMQQSQAQNARALRSSSESMQQGLAERGMGNSGASITAMMGTQQQLANANAGLAANVNYSAQDRALQAMQGAGNLSGDMRDSSMNEAFSRGSAADRFNMENTRRRQTVSDNNESSRVDAKRQAYDYEVENSRDQMGIYGHQRDRNQEREDEAAKAKRAGEKTVFNAVGVGI